MNRCTRPFGVDKTAPLLRVGAAGQQDNAPAPVVLLGKMSLTISVSSLPNKFCANAMLGDVFAEDDQAS